MFTSKISSSSHIHAISPLSSLPDNLQILCHRYPQFLVCRQFHTSNLKNSSLRPSRFVSPSSGEAIVDDKAQATTEPTFKLPTTETLLKPAPRGVKISVRQSTRRRGKDISWKVSSTRVGHGDEKITTWSHLDDQPTPSGSKITQQEHVSIFKRWWLTVKEYFIVGFMPKDYPDSVSSNYLRFTIWSTIGNISGTISSVLSTQALLHALGLGAGSAPLAAGLNWVLKDGAGQLGGVIYASMINSKFDAEPKRFRWTASVLLQLATVLELLTPMFPSYFIWMASLSNIGKNVGWIALAATRASMHKTFIKEDNLGDVTGKSGAQATAAGLIGTGLGVVLSYTLANEPTLLLALFAPVCVLNLVSAYQSNCAVISRTLDIQRAECVFYPVLEDIAQRIKAPDPNLFGLDVASPTEVASMERFVNKYTSLFPVRLEIEPDLDKSLQGLDVRAVHDVLTRSSFSNPENYILMIAGNTWEDAYVKLWYLEGVQTVDKIKGFYHACVLRYMIADRRRRRQEYVKDMGNVAGTYTGSHHRPVPTWMTVPDFSMQTRATCVADSHAIADSSFQGVLGSLVAQGWSVANDFLAEDGHRVLVDQIEVDKETMKAWRAETNLHGARPTPRVHDDRKEEELQSAESQA